MEPCSVRQRRAMSGYKQGDRVRLTRNIEKTWNPGTPNEQLETLATGTIGKVRFTFRTGRCLLIVPSKYFPGSKMGSFMPEDIELVSGSAP